MLGSTSQLEEVRIVKKKKTNTKTMIYTFDCQLRLIHDGAMDHGAKKDGEATSGPSGKKTVKISTVSHELERKQCDPRSLISLIALAFNVTMCFMGMT